MKAEDACSLVDKHQKQVENNLRLTKEVRAQTCRMEARRWVDKNIKGIHFDIARIATQGGIVMHRYAYFNIATDLFEAVVSELQSQLGTDGYKVGISGYSTLEYYISWGDGEK